jgi:serine/threonine protein kinase
LARRRAHTRARPRGGLTRTTCMCARARRDYFVQIAEALAVMHSCRVMHRGAAASTRALPPAPHARTRADIKPANIFLAPNGVVKIGDLGLGRSFRCGGAPAHACLPAFTAPSPAGVLVLQLADSGDILRGWHPKLHVARVHQQRHRLLVQVRRVGPRLPAVRDGRNAPALHVARGQYVPSGEEGATAGRRRARANGVPTATQPVAQIKACEYDPLPERFSAQLRSLVSSMLQVPPPLPPPPRAWRSPVPFTGQPRRPPHRARHMAGASRVWGAACSSSLSRAAVQNAQRIRGQADSKAADKGAAMMVD